MIISKDKQRLQYSLPLEHDPPLNSGKLWRNKGQSGCLWNTCASYLPKNKNKQKQPCSWAVVKLQKCSTFHLQGKYLFFSLFVDDRKNNLLSVESVFQLEELQKQEFGFKVCSELQVSSRLLRASCSGLTQDLYLMLTSTHNSSSVLPVWCFRLPLVHFGWGCVSTLRSPVVMSAWASEAHR